MRTTKTSVRTLAASAAILGGVLLAPPTSSSDFQPTPTEQLSAADASAVAAYARAHHLSGLSPASLAPVRVGCHGLSPASASECSEDVYADRP